MTHSRNAKALAVVITISLLRRFMSKVDINGDLDACHCWTGAKTKKGYGQFRHGGNACQAHRISYAIFIGPLEDGEEVDHECQNTSCVNPRHLRIMTKPENVADANVRRAEKRKAEEAVAADLGDVGF